MFRRFRDWLFQLDWVRGATPGSQLRRLFSYLVLCICVLITAESIYAAFVDSEAAFLVPAVALSVTALAFFLVVCVGVVFLASRHFSPDPMRLALDTVLSIAFTILAFSLLYRALGFDLTGDCMGPYDARDAVYFSAVTFSTLGYGDFRPCEAVRLWAAAQAIIGNLHLGLIVGAAFLSIQNK